MQHQRPEGRQLQQHPIKVPAPSSNVRSRERISGRSSARATYVGPLCNAKGSASSARDPERMHWSRGGRDSNGTIGVTLRRINITRKLTSTIKFPSDGPFRFLGFRGYCLGMDRPHQGMLLSHETGHVVQNTRQFVSSVPQTACGLTCKATLVDTSGRGAAKGLLYRVQ